MLACCNFIDTLMVQSAGWRVYWVFSVAKRRESKCMSADELTPCVSSPVTFLPPCSLT